MITSKFLKPEEIVLKPAWCATIIFGEFICVSIILLVTIGKKSNGKIAGETDPGKYYND